jgi:hypothetical protein
MARIAIATDNFNRADGPGLGGNWGNVGPFASSTGVMRINASINIFGGGGGDAAARWIGAGVFTNDQYSSLVLTGIGTDFSYVGVIARASGDQDNARDYYKYQMRGIFGTTALIKCVNGVETNLSVTPSTLTWVDGDRIEIEVEGTSIRGLQNGVVRHTATDSSLTTGAPGVFAAHISQVPPFGDDWEGGNITAGGVVFPGVITDSATVLGNPFLQLA